MDLVDAEIDRVLESTSGEAFAVGGGIIADSASVTARVRAYEAACLTLLAMASVGGFWAEEDHYSVWRRALARLSPPEPGSGVLIWLELQKYPATLLLYALGLGAVEANNLNFVGNLFGTVVSTRDNENASAVEALPPSCMFYKGGQTMQILEGRDGHFAPLNDWIHDALREVMTRITPDDKRYTLGFDRLEILLSLACAHRMKQSEGRYWAPPGAFGYRLQNTNRIFKENRLCTWLRSREFATRC